MLRVAGVGRQPDRRHILLDKEGPILLLDTFNAVNNKVTMYNTWASRPQSCRAKDPKFLSVFTASTDAGNDSTSLWMKPLEDHSVCDLAAPQDSVGFAVEQDDMMDLDDDDLQHGDYCPDDDDDGDVMSVEPQESVSRASKDTELPQNTAPVFGPGDGAGAVDTSDDDRDIQPLGVDPCEYTMLSCPGSPVSLEDDMGDMSDLPPVPEPDVEEEEELLLRHYGRKLSPIQRILKRLDPLNPGPAVVGRETEIAAIRRCLDISDLSTGSDLYLFGSTGTGKTTTMKSVLSALDVQTFPTVWLNCSAFSTPSHLYEHMWRHFCAIFPNDEDLKAELGLTSFKSTWRILSAEKAKRRLEGVLEVYKERRTKKLILVIDEMDWLNTGRNASVIYTLLEWKQLYPLVVVMISNLPDFKSPASQKAKLNSRQNNPHVAFFYYDRDRLADILNNRLQWDAEATQWVRENVIEALPFAVRYISTTCANSSGDARPCIAKLGRFIARAHQDYVCWMKNSHPDDPALPYSGPKFPLRETDVPVVYKRACLESSPRLQMLLSSTVLQLKLLLLLLVMTHERRQGGARNVPAQFRQVSGFELTTRFARHNQGREITGLQLKTAINTLSAHGLVSVTVARGGSVDMVYNHTYDASIDADEALACLDERKHELQPFYASLERVSFGM